MSDPVPTTPETVKDNPKQPNTIKWYHFVPIAVIMLLLNNGGIVGLIEKESAHPGSLIGAILGCLLVSYLLVWCVGWLYRNTIGRLQQTEEQP